MLQAENLKKTYITKEKTGPWRHKKKMVEAVKEVSLQLEKGQIIGLLGINGAGKTTTIKMLTTLLSPTSGRYTLNGIDAVREHQKVKGIINMVAGGERMIYWRLTAQENLWYFGQLYNVEKEVLAKRIPVLLQMVGLSGRENVPVETFSKGMKQRLQIARGLINDPEYLFMDEPTIGLDAVVAKELRQHVRHLAGSGEKGILLTSHYLGEVEELCDYLYVLDEGRLIKQGTSKALTREIFTKRVYELKTCQSYPGFIQALHQRLPMADITCPEEKRQDWVVVTCEENISRQLSQLCADKGFLLREMHEKKPSLEDAILRLAKEG